jgi:hypothetical protein
MPVWVQRRSLGQDEGRVENNAFQLSRIYGQGWNAARKLLAEGKSDLDAAEAAARNPYPQGEESARWTKGFMEALQSRAGSFATPGGSSWRPAVQPAPADEKAPRSTTGGSSSV